jgi:hypothetical protein
LFPDLPVFKWAKKSLRDVTINNGLHYSGIALTPPVSRFATSLDTHFEQCQQEYLTEKLARIDVKAITWNPDFVTDYVTKSFKRGRVSDEDIIILPRAVSELPSKSEMYAFSDVHADEHLRF